jgi:hypothetical protein
MVQKFRTIIITPGAPDPYNRRQTGKSIPNPYGQAGLLFTHRRRVRVKAVVYREAIKVMVEV